MEYGVSIVINDNRGRILIMRRSRKEKSFPGLWDLPGGKVEPLESLQEAAIREVKEESALFTDLDKSYFNIYKCPDRDLNIYGFGANMVRGR